MNRGCVEPGSIASLASGWWGKSGYERSLQLMTDDKNVANPLTREEYLAYVEGRGYPRMDLPPNYSAAAWRVFNRRFQRDRHLFEDKMTEPVNDTKVKMGEFQKGNIQTGPILCCKCSQEIDTSGTYVQRYLGDGKNGYEHTVCPIVGSIPLSEFGHETDSIIDCMDRRCRQLEREKALLHKRVEELESQKKFRDDLERRMVEQRGTVHVLTAEYASLKQNAESWEKLCGGEATAVSLKEYESLKADATRYREYIEGSMEMLRAEVLAEIKADAEKYRALTHME